MRKISALLLAAVGLATAGPAAAQPPAGEILLLQPPQGWRAEPVQKTDKLSVTRLLPPGQTEKDWTEMIMVQIYPGPEGTPRGYIDSVIQASRANCEAAGAGAVNERTVNGYPFAAASVTCTKGRQSGKGSVMMIQSLRGKEALYVVNRQWRGEPFGKTETPPLPKEIAQAWRNFPVGLCDTRDSQHPCPK